MISSYGFSWLDKVILYFSSGYWSIRILWTPIISRIDAWKSHIAARIFEEKWSNVSAIWKSRLLTYPFANMMAGISKMWRRRVKNKTTLSKQDGGITGLVNDSKYRDMSREFNRKCPFHIGLTHSVWSPTLRLWY